MRKIYIAGCGGMLGEAFYQQFKNDYVLKCTDIDLNESWLSYCDIREYREYRNDVINFSPKYLFHLGALTDLEYCETHPDETYATNTMAVENAVYIASELKIPLLYISTAGIFDGQKDLYDDWDIPNPMGHYARSKYAGEQFVKENMAQYLICRAGWMMGGGDRKDKKFIQKILKQLKDGTKEIRVVNDKLGTPTYTHDFANNVKLLLESRHWGVYNVVCGGITSRLEVAQELLRITNKNKQVNLIEVDSQYFMKEYFAPRPACERLINAKLNLRGMNIMRHWIVALEDYIDSYYRDYL